MLYLCGLWLRCDAGVPGTTITLVALPHVRSFPTTTHPSLCGMVAFARHLIATLSLVQQHHCTCRVRRLGALWCACAGSLRTHYIRTHACLLKTLLHATHTLLPTVPTTSALLQAMLTMEILSSSTCTLQHNMPQFQCECCSRPPLESPPATGTRSTMIMHYTITPCSSPAQTM